MEGVAADVVVVEAGVDGADVGDLGSKPVGPVLEHVVGVIARVAAVGHVAGDEPGWGPVAHVVNARRDAPLIHQVEGFLVVPAIVMKLKNGEAPLRQGQDELFQPFEVLVQAGPWPWRRKSATLPYVS